MSQMIASLEKELSIKLLYRSRYGIRLTLEGKQLFPSIQNAIAQYQSMQEMAKQIRGLDFGTIRIGTLSSISCHWLPRLIKGYQELYPHIEFILHQGDNNSIPEWVRTGEADFGFVNMSVLDNVKADVIKEGEYRAILPVDHPLADTPSVTLNELARDPFLVIEEGSFSRPLEAMRQQHLDPYIRLRAHDDYSILSMVETGLGVSILPELVLRKTNYNVAIVPIKPA